MAWETLSVGWMYQRSETRMDSTKDWSWSVMALGDGVGGVVGGVVGVVDVAER